MTDINEIKERLKKASITDGEIDKIEMIDRGDMDSVPGIPVRDVPEHIRVDVTCKPEEGSNIHIQVWLPIAAWNGSFLGIGNGGAAGMILPFVMVGPLKLGFAVASTDMGTSAGADCGIGNKAVWRDFGYRSTHLMTLAAKSIIECYYGVLPKYSYFNGTSTGGQQALSEAQRYPEDYDGILSGAPAYDRTNLHMGFVWDWLAVNKGEGGLFTKQDEEQIVKIILDKYGHMGERHPGDSFMYRPDKIKVERAAFESSGLTDRQIEGLMKIYGGVSDPITGNRIYEPVMMPGSEACDLGLTHRCEHPGFEQSYFYIFRWILGADFDFKSFDFHRDAKKVHEELDEYLNATQTDLAAFRDRGGKLLVIHGTADPIIPYTSSIRYYKQVKEKMGDVDSFFRLFLAPGMGHTSGGPGVQDILFGFPATPKDCRHLGILALKQWVEDGIAPDCLYPIAFKDNNPMNAFLDSSFGYERVIYPFKNDDKG